LLGERRVPLLQGNHRTQWHHFLIRSLPLAPQNHSLCSFLLARPARESHNSLCTTVTGAFESSQRCHFLSAVHLPRVGSHSVGPCHHVLGPSFHSLVRPPAVDFLSAFHCPRQSQEIKDRVKKSKEYILTSCEPFNSLRHVTPHHPTHTHSFPVLRIPSIQYTSYLYTYQCSISTDIRSSSVALSRTRYHCRTD
jgi:hypothetical protein